MIRLYHGSNLVVGTPEIRPMARSLDFGRAFYLTSSEEQAVKWARTSTLRRGDGRATVSIFEFDDVCLERLKILKFDEPSAEWLQFVSRNRNKGEVGL